MRYRYLFRLLFAGSAAFAYGIPFSAAAASDQTSDQREEPPAAEAWKLSGQYTAVVQWHPQFPAPYSGKNSLQSGNKNEETTDLTLYAGAHVWQGAEVWIDPEIDQGFGLSNTLGLAGYSSGEAYKVGKDCPYFRVPRMFLRQVFDLGGGETNVESDTNQLRGTRTADNVTLTVGKFSVVDVFDISAYAHDPRIDFLNWAVVDAGAFDYAADAWGFTVGAAAEWTQSWWTLRGGLFALSKEPNGKSPDTEFHQNALIGEWETRHRWRGHPGKIKVLAFANRGRMANYDDAVQLAQQTGTAPDVAQVRRDSSRSGYALNLEQEVVRDLGFFARVSANDGSKEAFEFTEINQSLSTGVSIKGDGWGRGDDAIGMAVVVNGLSAPARRYFAAGGLGILIGDGSLPRYGRERIAETYYALHIEKNLVVSADYQYIENPAYNRDRGPVSIFGLRAHAEF